MRTLARGAAALAVLTALAAAAHAQPVTLVESTVADLQAGMASHRASAQSLTRASLASARSIARGPRCTR
jgi:hypothetical protein